MITATIDGTPKRNAPTMVAVPDDADDEAERVQQVNQLGDAVLGM
jgi:hypothetical protein